MYCNKYNSLDKDTDLSSEIENNYMVFFIFIIFLMQDRLKQGLKPLLMRGYNKKNIKYENNSRKLKVTSRVFKFRNLFAERGIERFVGTIPQLRQYIYTNGLIDYTTVMGLLRLII